MKKLIVFITIFASLLASCASQEENVPTYSDVPTESILADTSLAETESMTELSTENAEETAPPDVLDRFTETVVEGEKYHLLKDGILLDSNKSLHITTKRISGDSNAKITSALALMGNIEYFGRFFDDEVTFFVDDTVLNVVLVRDGESDRIDYYTKSVTSRGRDIVLATDELPGTYMGCYDKSHITSSSLSIISDDNATMYINTGNATGNQKGYIFTDTGFGRINDFESSDCSISYYNFDYGENGRIAYTRKPDKYFAAEQYLGYLLQYCVARDEIAYEEGYVTFDTGIAVYHPNKIQTIGELFDLDKCYTDYKALANENSSMMVYNESGGYYQYGGIPLFDTVDELLTHNSAIYPQVEK